MTVGLIVYASHVPTSIPIHTYLLDSYIPPTYVYSSYLPTYTYSSNAIYTYTYLHTNTYPASHFNPL